MNDTTPKPLSEAELVQCRDVLSAARGMSWSITWSQCEQVGIYSFRLLDTLDTERATTKALREALKLSRKTIVRGKKAMNKLEWKQGLTDAEWISETSGVLVQIDAALGDTK